MHLHTKDNRIFKINLPTKHNQTRRRCALLLALLLVFSLVACNSSEEEEFVKPADYGRFGSQEALVIAENWPERIAGSVQEKETAAYIAKVFSELGYKPVVAEFSFENTNGEILRSQNIIVNISGEGFNVLDKGGETTHLNKRVVVGAHYDVLIDNAQFEHVSPENESLEEEINQPNEDEESEEDTDSTTKTQDTLFAEIELPMPTLAEFDGIHNNASGVAALLTLAKNLAGTKNGYDITLIAFGAGNAGFAGARAYLGDRDRKTLVEIDVMYNIDGIYAGDKVYAHAGRNSVVGGESKSYEKRRKLYEATDVYYEYELYTNNRFALYTNQSGVKIPWGDSALEKTAIYREWTLHDSDHTPFDELEIPIVFFESYDYDADKIELMKESSNPVFAATDGFISHTPFDSSTYLSTLFKLESATGADKTDTTDLLTNRINNVAFIIQASIEKGIYNAVTEE